MKIDEGRLIYFIVYTLMAVALLAPPAWWVFRSAMEARTYNRLTGKRVTTWDAMWVELRALVRAESRDTNEYLRTNEGMPETTLEESWEEIRAATEDVIREDGR